MIHRNVPETVGPISPVAECSHEPSLATAPLRPLMPSVKRTASTKTIVECPSEKKKPTLSGRWPSRHQLAGGVVDRADVVGVEGVAQPERVGGDADADAEHPASPSAKWCGATNANSRKNPMTCRPTTTAAMPATVLHCAGVSPPLIRAQREGEPMPAVLACISPPCLTPPPGMRGSTTSDNLSLLLRIIHS